MSPGSAPICSKILAIAATADIRLSRLRVAHSRVDAMPFGIVHRRLPSRKAHPHLGPGVSRRRPAHQRVDLATGFVNELENPVPGPCDAGRHGRLRGTVDACGHDSVLSTIADTGSRVEDEQGEPDSLRPPSRRGGGRACHATHPADGADRLPGVVALMQELQRRPKRRDRPIGPARPSDRPAAMPLQAGAGIDATWLNACLRPAKDLPDNPGRRPRTMRRTPSGARQPGPGQAAGPMPTPRLQPSR